MDVAMSVITEAALNGGLCYGRSGSAKLTESSLQLPQAAFDRNGSWGK
jgi:hypothetical protein